MFSQYKNFSVWSALEVILQPRRALEPDESMDIYSLGLLIWEVIHERVPFNGSLSECAEHISLNIRPLIRTKSEEQPANQCSESLSLLI